MALTPILSKLVWQHPRFTVEVYSDDAFVDIVERGFDAGIRLGEAVQRDMIAMRLTRPFRSFLSPRANTLTPRARQKRPAICTGTIASEYV
jgi:DNA-binding transcriptional LysR family regulator